MSNVDVSVIMPSLNVVDYIEKSLTSALEQTLNNIEIICVDAGSTDGTLEILKKYREKDNRIRLLTSDYKSYGGQVNLGIDAAAGKYIAILETDDYIESGMYEALFRAAEENVCDFVKCNYSTYWTQKDGTPFVQKRYNLWDSSLYGKVLDKPNPKDVCINDLYLWDGIYKKDFLRRNNIEFSETEGASFQDVGFLFQTSVMCKRIMYLNEAYYYYCIDREGSSSNSDKGFLFSFHEYNLVYSKYKDMIAQNEDVAKAFYCRLALALYNSVNDAMRVYGREAKPYYDWFRNEINWAYNRGIISDDDTNIGIPLESLWLSYDSYVRKQKERRETILAILGSPGQYGIVIFGSGHFGIFAYRWLKGLKYRITLFVDNDKAKWTSNIDGVPICDPETIDVLDEQTRYIIANNMHATEMKAQLMKLGVKEDYISVF